VENNMTKTKPEDYLAIILIGAGSSYARGPDKQDAIDRVAKIAASDWSGLYDLDGKECTVNVFTVTGHEKVWWDDQGVHTADDPKDDAELPSEQVKVTLSVPKRRR
jgi:hypothetical protein